MQQKINVPFISITRYEDGFLKSILEKSASLIRNGHFTGGPAVAQCEEALKIKTQSQFCVGCANGTDAIQLALRAAGIGANDEVLLPEMTFWATFEAIINVGAKPRTVDVSLQTLHLELSAVETAWQEKPFKALLLVHLYGWACPETLGIREFCKTKNIILIEDSAQAFETRIGNESLIGTATISTTSFYPAKVLGASGDAGAVFCKDPNIAKKIQKLRDHGRMSHYEYDSVGWNSRIGAYEATFLLESLAFLDSRISQRLKICKTYEDAFQNLPIKVLRAASGIKENGYANVLWIDKEKRSAFQNYLSENGVESRVIYPGAMSKQIGARPYLNGTEKNENADTIAHSVLSLPCFVGMTGSELEHVIQTVKKYF